MNTMEIAKELNTGKARLYEPDGMLFQGWNKKVQDAYKLDADLLAPLISDSPEFWTNYSRWDEFKLRPESGFW